VILITIRSPSLRTAI